MVLATDGEIANFLQAPQNVSPVRLYELFKESKLHGIVCAQILSALNLCLGGDQQISKDVMNEFY